MPRRKISEYRSKNIVNDLLGLPYAGWSVDSDESQDFRGSSFVVKVDQAVKQRFKKGLIYLDVAKKDIPTRLNDLRKKGYDSFLVEPYVPHDGAGERYLSLRRERDGVVLSYSQQGGVEIESHADSITSQVFELFGAKDLAATGFTPAQLQALRDAFDRLHLGLLEINPYVVRADGSVVILDVAIEVDSTAELLVDEWSDHDVRTAGQLTPQEQAVRGLNNESPASFSLELINPDGGIFLLLSGGGASVVIADEIFTRGHGNDLANYGEYSGNPTEHETQRYAEQVLQLLEQSKATRKVVFIGGAVANFTDIQATFKGIIAALRTHQKTLQRQHVKFFVRRGGPRQEQGLSMMEAALSEMGILGGVYGPSVSIPEAVGRLIEGLNS